NAILMPEFPVSCDQIATCVHSAKNRGRAPIVVVAARFLPEGLDSPAADQGVHTKGRTRLGGLANYPAPKTEEITGIGSRATILGHLQRGGSPTAYDRVLSTRLGMAAADLVQYGHWGKMASLKGTDIVSAEMSSAVDSLKSVPLHRWEE